MARFYSIGIGNGCSTTLIEESAKRGNSILYLSE